MRISVHRSEVVNDWTLIILVTLVAAYKLIERWIDSRSSADDETPPPGNDTLIETASREPARDDSERRIPDVQLGFQRNKE